MMWKSKSGCKRGQYDVEIKVHGQRSIIISKLKGQMDKGGLVCVVL